MSSPRSISDLARRLWRTAYWLPRDLALLYRARVPSHVVYFGGQGFGDDLLLTAVLEELRRRGHRRLAVISRHADFFKNGPPEIRFFPETWRLLEAARLGRAHLVHPKYLLEESAGDQDLPTAMHIITAMCQSAGLTGSVELKPRLYLTEEEKNSALAYRDHVVIQVTSPETMGHAPLKHWSVPGAQKLVDLLGKHVRFVQLGSAREPALAGVRDLRGRTSPRESAAILSQARCHVGYVGFLMHLARAVECPSVIVYGGREHPTQSGYVCNENLFTPLPCSPCWRRVRCDFDRACMTAITPERVVAAVEGVLARPSRPLPVEIAEIPRDRIPFPIPVPSRHA